MTGGLLEFVRSPEGQGLLGAVAGYAANAHRGAPLNSLGRGALTGLLSYGQAQEREQQQQLRAPQLKKAQAELADDEWVRQNAPKFYTPGTPAAGGVLDGSLPPEFRTGAVPVPAQAPRFDMQGFAHARMAQNPVKGMELLTALKKDTPYGKIDPSNFTQASLAKFNQSGNYADLEPARKMEVAPSGIVYNPYGVQPGTVFADPNKPFAPGPNGPVPNQPYQDFSLRKAAAGASRTNVSPVFKQEGEESKTVGKFFGESYAEIQKAGFTAQNTINRYDRLGQLLDGVDTGKFAPVGLEVAKAAESFGLKVDPKLANKEAAVALSGEIALQLRNPSGGAGMPGAMSDADRNFLTGMVPGIEKTPEGRALIIDTAKKMAKRDMDVARMAREYRQKHGTINEGFYDELARYSEANPLFGKSQAAQGGQALSQIPAANASNKGKFLTDTATGKRYQSNGLQWVEAK